MDATTHRPLYVALAAVFFPDHPIRLANKRYEQLQSGIKRHAFSMYSRMIDRSTGKIFALPPSVLRTGGRANFSPTLATVGADAAIGMYHVPKSTSRTRCTRAL